MTDEDIAKELALIKEHDKSQDKRLEEMEKRQDDLDKLVTSVALIANEQEHMRDDVREIKSDVKALTDKPAERWEGLVGQVIAAVVGAFLLWLVTGMPGLK